MSSTSRLALLCPLVRNARPTCGVVAVDGGCGVGVLRRLDARTPLLSAFRASAGVMRAIVGPCDAQEEEDVEEGTRRECVCFGEAGAITSAKREHVQGARLR
jgi:hypothetical protein